MPEGRFLFQDGELIDTVAGVKRQINCKKFADFVTKEYGLFIPRATLYAVCAHYNAGNNMLFAGDPGVGKTMTIKALAEYTGIMGNGGYIRVQVYPGITYVEFLGDWNYPKQLIATEALRGSIRVSPENIGEVVKTLEQLDRIIYNTDRMFRKGPAVLALEKAERGSILHIDELNRGSEEFQALLFEIAGEKQVTHPSGIATGEGQYTLKPFRSTDRFTSDGTEADWKTTFPQYPIVIATINEGDVATVELSNALLRRFMRIQFLRPGVREQLKALEMREKKDLPKAKEVLSRAFQRE